MNRTMPILPALLAGLLLLVGGLVTSSPAVATAPPGTPGPAGEVFLVRAGVASELLPDAEPGDDRQILALEILRPGEDPEWIEVPESEGVSADTPHFVLFEEASDTLFLVWQTRIGSHPVIKLASFRDGAWAEVIPVSDNVWSSKGQPGLAVTRDSFTVERDGEVRKVERTFLHVVWWEDTLEGIRALYRPLILEAGRLQGMGELYVLNDLIDLSGETPSGIEPSRSLLESPVLQSGRDSTSVVTGFADGETGRLVVAEIRLLPMGLGEIGEEVADFIANFRSSSEGPGVPGEDIRTLAGGVRGKILISGHRHRLNPRAVRAISEEVYDALISGSITGSSTSEEHLASPEDLRSLAGVVRGKILISGARIAGETLDRFNQAVAPSVLEMRTEEEAAQTGVPPQRNAPHLVRTQLLSSVPIPELAVGAQPHLFVSPDGTEVVIAWAESSALAYRKAVSGSWGEVRRMSLSEELPLTDALEILRRSVQPIH